MQMKVVHAKSLLEVEDGAVADGEGDGDGDSSAVDHHHRSSLFASAAAKARAKKGVVGGQGEGAEKSSSKSACASVLGVRPLRQEAVQGAPSKKKAKTDPGADALQGLLGAYGSDSD